MPYGYNLFNQYNYSHKDWAKYQQQLEILSKLRNLQSETINELNAMPLNDIFDIETDLRFLQGQEQGIEQGISLKTREFVQSLIKETDFDDDKISNLAHVELGFVKSIRAEIEGRQHSKKR